MFASRAPNHAKFDEYQDNKDKDADAPPTHETMETTHRTSNDVQNTDDA